MRLQTSFKLLQIESLLTVMMLSVPVLTVYLQSIGLDQTAVGISQAIFMTVAMLLDVPSGWIADRFSRKLSNCFGDVLVAVGLLQYATTQNFTGVIIAEVLIGAGIAFTNGADVGLLKAYAQKLKKDYAKVSAHLGTLRPLFEMIAFVSGGIIATYNIRATFLVSAIIFLIGAVLSLLVTEVGERRKTEKHPLRDMVDIAKFSLNGHPQLKWRIIAFAIAQNSTHTVIWIFTPMLLSVGFGFESLGFLWAVTLLFASLGSMLAHRFAGKLTDLQIVVLPLLVTIGAYAITGASLNSLTIGFALLFSLVRGWFIATLNPLVQQHAPPDVQATVISVASLARRLLYIPLVFSVNFLASHSLELALLSSALFYAIILIPLARGLRQAA